MKRADHASLPVLVQGLLARDGTAISWADLTWNPWMGCTKVGPACDHCYAEELMGTEGSRYKRVGWGPGQPRLRTAESNWAKPLRWQRVAAAAGVSLDVFCLSLGDWADKEVEDRWRLDLADVIIRTPNLRWLLLTKRIPNVERYLRAMFPQGVPPNVCLGITVVTQAEVDRDLPRALAVKEALGVRRLFLSCEPLLEALDLTPWLWGRDTPRAGCPRDEDCECGYRTRADLGLPTIDLVIVGGESGKDPRPMHPVWPLEIGHQCFRAGVPFHFKQWGEWQPILDTGLGVGKVHMHGRTYEGDAIFTFPDGQPTVKVGAYRAGRKLAGSEHLARIPA